MNVEAIEPGPMMLVGKLVEVSLIGYYDLEITWTKDDGGKLTTTLSWSTEASREANWRNAVKLWADRAVYDFLREPDQGQYTRRIGHGWYFAVLSGPPTWWLPRVKAKRWRFMVGWLRRGYVLSRVGH